MVAIVILTTLAVGLFVLGLTMAVYAIDATWKG